MKKIILFFFISLVLNTLTNAQVWRNAFDAPIPSIKGGCAVNQNTMWLVVANQSIFKSTDGGITWVDKYHIVSIRNNVYDICFVDSTTGFAGCNNGKILKTTNGGDTWDSLFVPDITYAITKIHFFNANLGFTLCTKSCSTIIYKTTNGGTSWISTATFSTAFEAMDFYSPTTGIATANAGYLYYTTDGATWNKAPSPTFPPSVTYSRIDQWGLKFISATTAVSGGWGSFAVGLQPTIFLKTTDGGATWNYMAQA